MTRPAGWIVLFASLALNVFVAGAFVGANLNRVGWRAPTPEARQDLRQRNPMAVALRGLPPEAQAAWREQTPRFATANGPRVREVRRLSREAMLGFGAEPFDAEATRAKLERVRALEHEGRLAMDRRLVAFAATLSPADRARFGEVLARPNVSRGQGPGRTP